MLNNIWRIIAIILFFIALTMLIFIIWLKNENKRLQKEIDSYNLTIEIMEKEMQEKAKELSKAVKEIENHTQQKIKVVKEYVYDKNQSECKNAIAILRSTGF